MADKVSDSLIHTVSSRLGYFGIGRKVVEHSGITIHTRAGTAEEPSRFWLKLEQE
jgi:phage-related holin